MDRASDECVTKRLDRNLDRNWPINQISCKVGPAIAAGCTMILKPTEIAPLNAILNNYVNH